MTDNLRILRELHNYAQAYVAEVLGMRQNSYSKLERNSGRIKAAQAQKLAQLYKVSLDELLSEERPVITFRRSTPINTDEIQTLKKEVAFLREQNSELLKRMEAKPR